MAGEYVPEKSKKDQKSHRRGTFLALQRCFRFVVVVIAHLHHRCKCSDILLTSSEVCANLKRVFATKLRQQNEDVKFFASQE